MLLPAVPVSPSSRPWLAALPVVGLGLIPVAFGVFHGGYFPTTWMAVGVLVSALAVILRLAAGPTVPGVRAKLPIWAAIGAVFLLLFAVWNLASIGWATDKAAALQESTRVLFYLMIFLLAGLVVTSESDVRHLCTTLVIASATVAAVTVGLMIFSPSPLDYFREFKLDAPLGYSNAQATFFLIPALLGVHLSSRLSTRPWLRPLLFASAVILLETSVMTQSRGGFWALVAGVAVYFALVPDRPRALLWWGLALLTTFLAFNALNAPQVQIRAREVEHFAQTVRGVGAAMSLSMLASLAVAGILVVADHRLPRPRWFANAARIISVVIVVVLAVLLVDRFPALTHPVKSVDSAWSQFKASSSTHSDVRILDLSGSYRYELWVVAWNAFERQPVLGLGADSYPQEWARLRPVAKDVRQPHNLYLRLLAELGLPGLMLFGGGVAPLLGGAFYRAARRSVHARALAAGIAAAACVFLVHAAAEWVWNIPATASAFFALLGALLGVGAPSRDPMDPDRAEQTAGSSAGRTSAARTTRGTLLTAIAALGALSLLLAAPQTLSLVLLERASTLAAQGHTSEARQAAALAHLANPLDDEPHIVAGRALGREGQVTQAEQEFARAVEINPGDWRTYLTWGDTRRDAGKDPSALYERARALNPLSAAIAERVGDTQTDSSPDRTETPGD